MVATVVIGGCGPVRSGPAAHELAATTTIDAPDAAAPARVVTPIPNDASDAPNRVIARRPDWPDAKFANPVPGPRTSDTSPAGPSHPAPAIHAPPTPAAPERGAVAAAPPGADIPVVPVTSEPDAVERVPVTSSHFTLLPLADDDRIDLGDGLLALRLSVPEMLGGRAAPQYRVNMALPDEFAVHAWHPTFRPGATTPLPQRDGAGYAVLISDDRMPHHMGRAILGRLRDAGWCGLRIDLPTREALTRAHITDMVVDHLRGLEPSADRPLVVIGSGDDVFLAAHVAGRLQAAPDAVILVASPSDPGLQDQAITTYLFGASWPTLHLQPPPPNWEPSTVELVTAGGVDQPWSGKPGRTIWRYTMSATPGATWLPLLADPAATWIRQVTTGGPTAPPDDAVAAARRR